MEEAPAKRSKLNPQEEEALKLGDFIRKFNKMGYSYYAFQVHNLLIPHPPWIDTVHARDFAEVKNMGVPVEVRELRHEKHLSHDMILAMTNNFSEENFIQKSFCGQQFRGKNELTNRDVIIKRWDFKFPLSPFYREVLPRFSHQLELVLNEDVASHPNMAKLIGFSCETRLALVWDLKLTKILHHLIPQGCFTWDQRLKVARQVADAILFSHDKKIAICNFFSPCINVDENFNIKLFEFDRCVNLANEYSLVGKGILGGYIRYYSPETMTPDLFETQWFYASDVYHFGLLLLELTLSKCVAEEASAWIEQAKAPFEPQMKMIFDLAMTCVQENPTERPEMALVVKEFHSIVSGMNAVLGRMASTAEDLAHKVLGDNALSGGSIVSSFLKSSST